MPHKVKVTIDHDEVRRWVEARGGWPAMVQRAGAPGSPGELRVGFPDSARDEKVNEISWGEFLQKFDEGHVALEYEERDEEGGLSEFHQLIPRQQAENARLPELRRPTMAEGRRLERLAEPGAERISEEKGYRRKRTVRTIKAGVKEKKRKIHKAA
jgi:hypothetical protein